MVALKTVEIINLPLQGLTSGGQVLAYCPHLARLGRFRLHFSDPLD
jgi:hypothetical protein